MNMDTTQSTPAHISADILATTSELTQSEEYQPALLYDRVLNINKTPHTNTTCDSSTTTMTAEQLTCDSQSSHMKGNYSDSAMTTSTTPTTSTTIVEPNEHTVFDFLNSINKNQDSCNNVNEGGDGDGDDDDHDGSITYIQQQQCYSNNDESISADACDSSLVSFHVVHSPGSNLHESSMVCEPIDSGVDSNDPISPFVLVGDLQLDCDESAFQQAPFHNDNSVYFQDHSGTSSFLNQDASFQEPNQHYNNNNNNTTNLTTEANQSVFHITSFVSPDTHSPEHYNDFNNVSSTTSHHTNPVPMDIDFQESLYEFIIPHRKTQVPMQQQELENPKCETVDEMQPSQESLIADLDPELESVVDRMVEENADHIVEQIDISIFEDISEANEDPNMVAISIMPKVEDVHNYSMEDRCFEERQRYIQRAFPRKYQTSKGRLLDKTPTSMDGFVPRKDMSHLARHTKNRSEYTPVQFEDVSDSSDSDMTNQQTPQETIPKNPLVTRPLSTLLCSSKGKPSEITVARTKPSINKRRKSVAMPASKVERVFAHSSSSDDDSCDGRSNRNKASHRNRFEEKVRPFGKHMSSYPGYSDYSNSSDSNNDSRNELYIDQQRRKRRTVPHSFPKKTTNADQRLVTVAQLDRMCLRSSEKKTAKSCVNLSVPFNQWSLPRWSAPEHHVLCQIVDAFTLEMTSLQDGKTSLPSKPDHVFYNLCKKSTTVHATFLDGSRKCKSTKPPPPTRFTRFPTVRFDKLKDGQSLSGTPSSTSAIQPTHKVTSNKDCFIYPENTGLITLDDLQSTIDTDNQSTPPSTPTPTSPTNRIAEKKVVRLRVDEFTDIIKTISTNTLYRGNTYHLKRVNHVKHNDPNYCFVYGAVPATASEFAQYIMAKKGKPCIVR